MSSELDPPTLPTEKLPRKPKMRVLTPDEEAEREALFEQIKAITTVPAIDDPDDDVLFDQVMKPMIKLGKTDVYRRHWRAVVCADFWKTFTNKAGHMLEGEAMAARIDAYNEELREASDA